MIDSATDYPPCASCRHPYDVHHEILGCDFHESDSQVASECSCVEYIAPEASVE